MKFWTELFTTRQIAIEKFHNDQILKKTLVSRSPLSTAFTPKKWQIFCAVSKSTIWILMIITCQILNIVFFNETVFQFKKLHRPWFWAEKFFNASDFELKIQTRFQIWNLKIYNVSDFELKNFHCSRFCRKQCNQEITFWFVFF